MAGMDDMDRMEKRKMKRKNSIFIIIGLTSVFLLLALMVVSVYMTRQKEVVVKDDDSLVQLDFQTEELTYDGTGTLDLMNGVTALSADGSDVSDQVNAVVMEGKTLSQKKIQYSVFSDTGKETIAYRPLILKNYTGPSIETEEKLVLEAKDFNNLNHILSQDGRLKVQDGFGKDVTSDVSWVREKVSDGLYEIEFSYVNEFQDSTEKRVSAVVSGNPQDLSVTTKDEVRLRTGDKFDPSAYIEISDPSGSGSAVQVTGEVDTQKPGRYSINYTVLSADGSQRAQASLKVVVE